VLGVRSKEGEEERSESKGNVSRSSTSSALKELIALKKETSLTTFDDVGDSAFGWRLPNLNLDLNNKEYLRFE